jgi:membrane-bound metal-dependent hydrolase YbcI (DUF457 family)
MSRDRAELRNPWRVGTTVGAALLPDVDLAFQFVDGRNHHGAEMHGIGFALVAAVAGALVFRLLAWRRPLALGLAVGLAYATHPLLDYLNVDTHPPIGILALWPFSSAYYKVPWPIFMDIGRTLEWATVAHNAIAGAWEAALLLPVLWVAWRWRSRRLEGAPWHEGSRANR